MPDGKPLDVGEELRALHASVLDVRDKLEEEGRKRDVRIATSEQAIADAHTASTDANAAAVTANDAASRSNWIALGAVLVALASLVVGGVGVHAASRANHALAVSESERQARTLAACLQANDQEAKQAAAEKSEERARQAEWSQALDRLLVLLQITPADLAAIQAKHLRKFDATVDQAHPMRDCSPKGLALYYGKQRSTVTTTTGR